MLPTNASSLNLPNKSFNSTNASKGGEAEQKRSNDGYTLKVMNDRAVAVVTSSVAPMGNSNESDNSKLSVLCCVAQPETPRTCNTKGKTTELNVSEERKKKLNAQYKKPVVPEVNYQWTCGCRLEWDGKRKKCKCGKWKGGKRENIVRKKKNVNSSVISAADKPTHQLNQQHNNQQSKEINMQTRMIIDVLQNLGTIIPVIGAGVSIGTIHADKTMETGNETIRKLFLEDTEECRIRGKSGEEGNGFFILQDLDDSCVMSYHDQTLHDGIRLRRIC